MSFALPLALLSLLAVPLLAAGYLWQVRRNRRRTVRYSDVSLLRAAAPARARWKRHVAPALLLLAVVLLGVAAARPQATVVIPSSRTTIMLALDVSRSMCATDVEPNRLTVAQDAAAEFVSSQPGGMRIGLVVFAGGAQLVVPPTTDEDELLEAIAGLTTARGTAIGAAILTGIDAIAESNPDVAPVGAISSSGAGSGAAPNGAGATGGTGDAPDYVADIVVVLTDGANTRGIEPLDAAPIAAERGVRVYTIGFGTSDPAGLVCSSAQLGGDAFGDGFGGGAGGGFRPGGGGGPPRRFLVIDEPTLQAVAEQTGGEYYRAESADQLVEVFETLPAQVELQEEEREITQFFAIAGALVVALAMAASFRWSPRL